MGAAARRLERGADAWPADDARLLAGAPRPDAPVTVKVGLLCEECRRRFGGRRGFELHRIGGRCRSAAELGAVGLRRNAYGVWVRSSPRNGQATLPGIVRRGRPPRKAPQKFRDRALVDVQAGPGPSPSEGPSAAPRRSEGPA